MTLDFIPGVSLHARHRAVERLGRDPDRADWLAAVASILDRTALLLACRDRDGGERWRVQFGTIEADVWWSPSFAQIVTVLDPAHGALNPKRQAERHAQRRGQGVRQPYQRQRARMEDWG